MRQRTAVTAAILLLGWAFAAAAWKPRLGSSRRPALLFPARICVDGGRLVVADSVAQCLYVWNRRSRRPRVISVAGKPLGVAVVSRPTRFLVGNATKHSVELYSPGGRLLGRFPEPVGIPQAIAVAPAKGLVFVADAADHSIKVFDLRSWRLKYRFGGPGGGPGEFDFPSGIAYDSAGERLVVADLMNRRLQVFDLDGNWIQTITRSGTRPMVRPQGVAVDRAGNIYVADSLWAGVYVFDPAGEPLDVLGEYGTGRGQVRTPLDVAVAAGGKVLVADFTNRRITGFAAPGGVQ